MQVLLIPADRDQSAELVDIVSITVLLDGPVEAVSLNRPDVLLYVREDAGVMNLAHNQRATALIMECNRSQAYFILGDGVIIGRDQLEDTDVPDEFVGSTLLRLKLPLIRVGADDGYSWMDKLSGGWYSVPSWGHCGWDLGRWPYVCVAHYDGDGLYGVVTYVEGDLTTKGFATREERDKETDEIATFYWQSYETIGAPKKVGDARLGPYKG